MRAEIYIEDTEHGASVRFVFPDGFHAASGAHQLSNIIKVKLDQMAEEGVITDLGGEAEFGDVAGVIQQRQAIAAANL